MKTGPKPRPVADRFWTNVPEMPGDDCWEWQGHISDKGYGVIGVGSRTDASRRRILAHRLSYELCRGSIPDGLFVCHSCDNPACVNPNHLFLGDQLANMQDAGRKGRCHNPLQSSKTHCPQGHEYSPENTYYDGRGRQCRTCNRQHRRDHYYRHHEASVQRVRDYRERLKLTPKQ